MTKTSLPFRQVHLDFHTSPDIASVGRRFDPKHWQETLRRAAVNSITCFAKCHHGWSYHPTAVGKMHPSLSFDLLRSQYEACKEIGLRVPIYLSAGVDDLAAREHPEWREVSAETGLSWPGPLEPGFKMMDFHSPYLDYLCAQIAEVVRLFPECDGIFLDIVAQSGAGSPWSLDFMAARGLDSAREEDREISLRAALQAYYERTTRAVKDLQPGMPVFHNSGHITRGDKSTLEYQDHLELESLPTGGWGYDHFPESAKYAAGLGREFLGMTGKFHLTWGEFGGFKHPNALRYECSAMLAYGARCSVGDQLHPEGLLDQSTYEIIGAAYCEVETKEPWCAGAEQVVDVAVLSSESEGQGRVRENASDTGAARLLLETHALFGIIDREGDFSSYRVLILPDDIRVDEILADKIGHYLGRGGRLLISGESGLSPTGEAFALDIGARWEGPSNFDVDYVLPEKAFQPNFVDSPFLMTFPSQRVKATQGKSMGAIHYPYFNRRFRHYCSHGHAPPRLEASGYECGVMHGNVTYLAHPVFSLYRSYGAVVIKDYIAAALKSVLPEPTVKLENFPSTGRVTLTRQPAERRWILHLLYATTISRGGRTRNTEGSLASAPMVEVIEDLVPLAGVKVRLRLSAGISRVSLEPGQVPVAFQTHETGEIEVIIDTFCCHQMIVFWE